jgi:hypothetical protein
MTTNSLLVRIVMAGLPLVVIALIAGAAGYVTKGAQTRPVPPLPAEAPRATGIQGAVQSFSNDQLTIITADGAPMTFNLPGQSTVERLTAITRAELQVGAWINGGAMPHAQTVLALVGLVLISDPVLNTP